MYHRLHVFGTECAIQFVILTISEINDSGGPMLAIEKAGLFRKHGQWCGHDASTDAQTKAKAREKTISYSILSAHNTERNGEGFKICFDGLMAHGHRRD